jgi:hypothetical protein
MRILSTPAAQSGSAHFGSLHAQLAPGNIDFLKDNINVHMHMNLNIFHFWQYKWGSSILLVFCVSTGTWHSTCTGTRTAGAPDRPRTGVTVYGIRRVDRRRTVSVSFPAHSNINVTLIQQARPPRGFQVQLGSPFPRASTSIRTLAPGSR